MDEVIKRGIEEQLALLEKSIKALPTKSTNQQSSGGGQAGAVIDTGYAFSVNPRGKGGRNGIDATVLLQFSLKDYMRFREAYTAYNKGLRKELGLAGYVMLAVSNLVNRQLFPGYPLTELEDATDATIGLLTLLSERCGV